MPSVSNGSTSSSAVPDQPIQAPSFDRMTGSSAVTRPPGEGFQRAVPSCPISRSTGSRFETTTKSNRSR